MSTAAFFVDLPNFYSRLLKSGLDEPRLLRDYFLHWLDFDLLARSLAEFSTGVWVFYSGDRIGPSSERIDGKYLQDYIRRINSLEGVTARDVNIRGEQREPVYYKCENCGQEGTAQVISEKGIDASLTVHLFDTMDSWDMAYLLSGDADFVPAVVSLRRKGKIVVGVGFPDASGALIQECYNYIDVLREFIEQDYMIYLIFKEDGVAKKWLISDVLPKNTQMPLGKISPRFYWSPRERGYVINFDVYGRFDETSHRAIIEDLKSHFPENIRFHESQNSFGMTVKVVASDLEVINRNVGKFQESIENLGSFTNHEENKGFFIDYEFDQETKRYKSTPPNPRDTS